MISSIYKKQEDNIADGEAGFSLLEMLIALSIMSLTSLALFQSIGAMLNISDRAVDVSERKLDKMIVREAMEQLVDGLITDWEDRPEESFIGKPLSFSGVSANAVHTDSNNNATFKVSLQRGNQETQSLFYEAETGDWVIETGLSGGVYFEYLGRENTWHRKWPPDKKPTLETQDALRELSVLHLPLAIRLKAQSGRQQFIYVVGRHQSLPDRLDIIRG